MSSKSRSLTENYIYNIIYQVFVTFLPLVTTPYVTRVLGVTAIGMHTYTESIVTYFILFGSLGISLYGCRKIAYVRNDEEELSKTTWEIIYLKLFLMIVSLIVFIPFFCFKTEYSLLYTIQILNILANGIDISWFFQGIEDFKTITIRNVVIKIFFVIVLFVVIRGPQDLWLYVLLIVGSSFAGNVVMFFYLSKNINSVRKYKGKIHPFSHMKGTLVLFLPQITNYIYSSLDRSMLKWLTGIVENVAIYDLAQRLIRTAIAVLQSIGYVMMARISNLSSNQDDEGIRIYIRKSINFNLFLSIPITFGVIGVAAKFVPLFYGPGYEEVIPTLMYLTPIIIFISLNSVLGVQLLVALGEEKKYTIATTMGALVNIILNIIFIPKQGVVGACFASVCAEVSVFLLEIYFTKKYVYIKNIIMDNLVTALGGVLMLIIVSSIGTAVSNMQDIFVVLIQVLMGASVYFVLMIITKNTIMIEILGKLRNMISHRIHK